MSCHKEIRTSESVESHYIDNPNNVHLNPKVESMFELKVH